MLSAQSESAAYTVQTAWERAVRALERRGVALGPDGLVACPTCAHGNLWVHFDLGKISLKCFSGCETLTSMRACGLKPSDLTAELEAEVLTEVEKQKGQGLETLSAEEFEADVAPDALIAGMLYRATVTTCNGASKVGKSYFALQAEMAIASGSEFLGLETVQATVLHLSLELSAGSVRTRMRAIADATGLPVPKIGERFHVIAPTRHKAVSLNLAEPTGRARLAAAIRNTGAELVVLDTLYRFCPGLDPSSNAEMGELFGHLNELAHETGCALLVLDHAAKGEQLGPASHSGIGAQAKGGSAASIISLKRTSREDGGRWSVDVDSWFGSWDEPIYYERPKLHTGDRGAGCVPCGAAEAFGLPLEKLRDLFLDHAERDADGRAYFSSKNALTQALIAAKYATGNAGAAEIISAIQRDHCVPAGSRIAFDRPVATSEGPRKAVVFTWRFDRAQLSDPER